MKQIPAPQPKAIPVQHFHQLRNRAYRCNPDGSITFVSPSLVREADTLYDDK